LPVGRLPVGRLPVGGQTPTICNRQSVDLQSTNRQSVDLQSAICNLH
jgi:hypothetical protein